MASEEKRKLATWGSQIAILALVVFLIDHFVFGAFTTTTHPLLALYEQKIAQYKNTLQTGHHYDVIFVGSSMTNSGLDPAQFDKLTGLDSYNAGIASNAPVNCGLEIVQQLLDKMPPKIVVYGIETFSLQLSDPCPVQFRPNTSAQFVELFDAHRNAFNLKGWVKGALQGHMDTLPAHKPEAMFSKRIAKYGNAVLHENGWLEVHAAGKTGFLNVSGNAPFIRKHMMALEEMARLCRSRGVRLVLVELPEYEGPLKAYADGHQRMASYLADFSKTHGVTFLNYSGNPAFPFRDIGNFYDTNHLNARGAALMTDLLARSGVFEEKRPSAPARPNSGFQEGK